LNVFGISIRRVTSAVNRNHVLLDQLGAWASSTAATQPAQLKDKIIDASQAFALDPSMSMKAAKQTEPLVCNL
jgi:hypothetical protein